MHVGHLACPLFGDNGLAHHGDAALRTLMHTLLNTCSLFLPLPKDCLKDGVLEVQLSP